MRLSNREWQAERDRRARRALGLPVPGEPEPKAEGVVLPVGSDCWCEAPALPVATFRFSKRHSQARLKGDPAAGETCAAARACTALAHRVARERRRAAV